MRTKYMQPRNVRTEYQNPTGRFRGGRLFPVMAVPFEQSESGMVQQSVLFELDPIAGRLITDIMAHVTCVFVPVPGIYALKNPGESLAGSSEYIREQLLTGAPLFDLIEENALTKVMRVNAKSVAGVKLVNEMVTIGHNAAVNHLRQRKYVHAELLTSAAAVTTPSIIGQTVLDRLNAVLDPEDRVNGAVDFSYPEVTLPVDGFGMRNDRPPVETDVSAKTYEGSVTFDHGWSDVGSSTKALQIRGKEGGRPDLSVTLGAQSSRMSLVDFYEAERMDALTRQMRQIVDENPEYGGEQVQRFAAGLAVEVGKVPFVVYEGAKPFRMTVTPATDGASLGQMITNNVQEISFTVPIPATEFGGILYTFAEIKPDETLAHQPHPILSEPWGRQDYIVDEMAFDPVPVTYRDVDSEVDQADEGEIACYIGKNGLKRNYATYGLNHFVDDQTVANRTALWQLDVPMSVTPESVLYPEDFEHYPFADQQADVCTYTARSVATINTPTIFGPTPVEELAEIEDADIFGDDE